MTDLIPFEPALWAPAGHSQTILGDWLPSPKFSDAGRKFVVELDDGDKLLCRLHLGNSPFIFVLCHGLIGDADAGYNHRIGRVLHMAGHTICRMNHRNCGEGRGHARMSYHAGRSGDIARIVFDLKKHFPTKKVVVVGFSLSGNATLLLAAGVVPCNGIFTKDRFLEEAPKSNWALPDYNISINPPVELSKTTDRFLQNFNRLYQWNFVRSFHKMVKDLEKKELLDQPYKTHSFMTIRQFDDTYTALRGGYESAENYYSLCGAVSYLKQVFVPSFVLMSKDDPIIDFNDMLHAKKSEHLQMHIENQGGHMGYLAKRKTPLGDHRWLDYVISEKSNQLTFL